MSPREADNIHQGRTTAETTSECCCRSTLHRKGLADDGRSVQATYVFGTHCSLPGASGRLSETGVASTLPSSGSRLQRLHLPLSFYRIYTLLGMSGPLKRIAIGTATKPAERASRWLWFKRVESWLNDAGTQVGASCKFYLLYLLIIMVTNFLLILSAGWCWSVSGHWICRTDISVKSSLTIKREQ